jgi:tRNA threonylcarbamoyladenosine biosynthesis protein TsaB
LKILALDTSTEACSAAIMVESEIIQKDIIAPRRHGELILPMIDELLATSGLTLNNLDAIAFGRGPGAFTGIRIAAGIAQGLAFGADLPVVPISTLAALAQGSEKSSQYIISAIDARMGEIYMAIYKTAENGLVDPISDELVLRPDDISITTEGSYIGVGTGWGSYRQILQEKVGQQLISYNGECYPLSRDILLLSKREFERGNVVNAEQALPVYLRNNVTG